jgi:CDP-paratose 2-epimerase
VSHAALRPFDVPWVVLDSAKAHHAFNWQPEMTLPHILAEIAEHVETHPEWLSMTGA